MSYEEKNTTIITRKYAKIKLVVNPMFEQLHFVFQMMKGDFYVLEYVGWDTTYTEIVSSDRLRPKNTNPAIEKGMFFKFEIEVPEEVRE